MMTHYPLNLGRLCWHTQDDVVGLWLMMVYMVKFWLTFLSKSRQLTSPHSENWPNPINQKLNPNLEFRTNLDNFEIILIILCLSVIEHSADISV